MGKRIVMQGHESAAAFLQWEPNEVTSSPSPLRGLALLPTRVIAVGSEEDPTVRLWVTKGQKGRYTALSHCWGASSIIRTVKLNYFQHQSSISIAAMSQTFQDAIVVTRRLNIPYLWIDSLCIIQDSAEDWQSESVTMDSIYQNAEVTVAALAASDGSGGCFRPTVAHRIRPCSKGNRWHVHNAIIAPLNSRGWILQETMLSTRVLMYRDTELRWACLETRAC
ncbi:HET-domain-containing protein [Stipitochalara longipes BDJ]|nr:HET-domain-containing protein [Stipitochalara longipes BDJ]